MKNKVNYLIITLVCISLLSCSKKIAGVGKSGSVAEELTITDTDFDYLSTSSKIKFTNEKKTITANASIRIKKDSIIWISLSPGLGVEAARGIVTQDSMIFINRLNKEFSAYNFKELSEEFNFDITYQLLQSALLGNLPFKIRSQDKVKKEDTYFLVKQEVGPLTVNNYIDGHIMKLDRVDMHEKSRSAGRNNTLKLRYDEFKELEERVIPFFNLVSLSYQNGGQQQNTEINIQHRKAYFPEEALDFPFKIPEKYERK